jgi:hypothetical protein
MWSSAVAGGIHEGTIQVAKVAGVKGVEKTSWYSAKAGNSIHVSRPWNKRKGNEGESGKGI